MYKIVTVELKMGVVEADRYAEIHEAALSDVRRSGDAIDSGLHNTSPMGMAVYRRLSFDSFHTRLDGFFRSEKITTANVADWSDHKDYGTLVYFQRPDLNCFYSFSNLSTFAQLLLSLYVFLSV